MNFWKWPDGIVWKITNQRTIKSRKEKFDLFMTRVKPGPEESVLDVGVSPGVGRATNFLELWYPYPENIVALANEKEKLFSAFKKDFPKVKLVFGDGRQLPFENDSFDVVFSNAIIEHVGNKENQRLFISELVRVCKRAAFITTANYYYPLESHTMVPLVHYLPHKPRFWIYKKLGRYYYASLETLNLLTPRQFKELFFSEFKVELVKKRLLGIVYNIIAIVNKNELINEKYI